MQSLARFSRFVKQFSAKGGYPVDIKNPDFYVRIFGKNAMFLIKNIYSSDIRGS